MNCLRAQSEVSRVRDAARAIPPAVDRHLAACEECASFRDTTEALERRYRRQVRSGIDRLRRLDAPSFRPRRSLGRKLLVPVAAAVLVCGWGWLKAKPEGAAAPIAFAVSSKGTSPRSLLFDGAGLVENPPELSFLDIGEPRLPIRLEQELHRIGGSDPEIVLPRNLTFRN